jgi:hypothetical protein
MSKHEIIIHEGFYWDVDDLLLNAPAPSQFWNNPKPSLNQNVVQPRSKSTFSLPILNMPPLQTMNMSLFDSWIDSFPRFNSYPKNKKKCEYIMDVNIDQFKQFLYSNDFITVSEDKGTLLALLKNSAAHEDMIIHLQFLKVSEKLFSNRKKFFKTVGDQLVYYYDTSKPSVIELKSSDTLDSNNVFNHQTKQSYMERHYYNELSLFVDIIKNPDTEKLVPAIVVSDLDNRPLEVHCYYKNKYIPNDLIKEIKPNLLIEDFLVNGYFDKRDLEFIDMAMI